MNKFFQRLLLFEKVEIQTKLSCAEVLDRIDSFCGVDSYNGYTDSDYYGSVFYDGFFIGEKNRKFNGAGYTHNSFAPVMRAKVDERDGMTVISGVLRMNTITLIPFSVLYLLFLLTIVLFPILHIILHFAYFRSAKRLKEKIQEILLEI